MQRLNVDEVEEMDIESEFIPALEDAEYYFCYLTVNTQPVLAILDNGTWRPTTQDEIIKLMH